jgi:FtsP/CotA-like multicopper oxidase with cupredoxin domain
MDTGVPQPRQEPSLSRRRFLGGAARAAAGTIIAPTILSATGCRKAATPEPAVEDADYTLRATSFQGTPDGREREIWGYNGRFPGPLLRVKEGETLRVKVINELSVPTSIHWHGMHQPGT